MVSYANPTFRIVYLDSETLVPMEYDNYYINISRTMGESVKICINLEGSPLIVGEHFRKFRFLLCPKYGLDISQYVVTSKFGMTLPT